MMNAEVTAGGGGHTASRNPQATTRPPLEPVISMPTNTSSRTSPARDTSTPPSGTQPVIKVTVWRGDAAGGAYREYDVPQQRNQSVLDVVSWIQHHLDPGLAYRFACRVGMCGSCAMMVNGRPRWTCRTHVGGVIAGGRLRLAPLRNLPVIRDLVADMEPFFAKWDKAGGRHHPGAGRHDPPVNIAPQDPDRAIADAGIECINCGICHAACDTVAANQDYLGPAPLQRAWTLVNDRRDADRDAVLYAAMSSGGCHACHSMGSCTHHCPVGLDPMGAIAGLKRLGARRILGGARRQRGAGPDMDRGSGAGTGAGASGDMDTDSGTGRDAGAARGTGGRSA